MEVNIYIGDTKLEDLSLEEQQKVGKFIADAFAEIKVSRLKELIENDDPRAEQYYQELVDCIVKKEDEH